MQTHEILSFISENAWAIVPCSLLIGYVIGRITLKRILGKMHQYLNKTRLFFIRKKNNFKRFCIRHKHDFLKHPFALYKYFKGYEASTSDEWIWYLNKTEMFINNAQQVLSKKQYDICIANDNVTLLAADAVARDTKAKLLYDAIECPPIDTRAGDAYANYSKAAIAIINNAEGKVVEKCDAIMTIGPSLKKWMSEHYKTTDKFEVIRNCRNFIEKYPKSNIRKDCKLAEDDVLILFINGLYPGQGGEELIQMMTHLPKHVHCATLGPVTDAYKAELEKYAKKEKVGKRLHIFHALPWDEALAYASGADIGIIPRQADALNNWLSLPNRIFELVMARLPVASSALPDIAQIVTDYDIGRIFEQTDPEKMAETLKEMIAPEMLAHFKKNVEKAAQDLTWENEKEKLVSFVNQLNTEKKKSLSICLISRKNIAKNNRIARISRALTEQGHHVEIAAPFPPGDLHVDPKATYHIVKA